MPRHPYLAASATGLSDRIFSRLAASARSLDRTIYPLHIGDTFLPPPQCVARELRRAAQLDDSCRYSPPRGEPLLLEAIATHLRERSGRNVDVGNIQVTLGATGGLSVVTESLLDPGDEVLLLSPFWPLIRGIIRKRGARAIEIPFFTEIDTPTFDAEALIGSQVTARTAAIYLNSPHNPTGRILSDDVLAAIARVAAHHNLWILCDEVYEDLFFTSSAHVPPWSRRDFAEQAIAVHSFSKAYGMAGARVGFVHGPATAMKAIRGVQTFATYCAPKAMQFAAAATLREGQPWLKAAKAEYLATGTLAAKTLNLEPPQGGTFLFWRVAPYLRADESTPDFLERCFRNTGVLLTPGASSGEAYGDWVRLCFTAVCPEETKTAVELLRAYVIDSGEQGG